MSDRNPFAPPTTAVRDVADTPLSAGDTFVPDGRIVSAGQGWQWFVQSWRVFKARPLTWWLALSVAFGAFVLASLVPLLNIVAMVSFPLIMAGIGSCASSVMRTGRFDVAQIFDGFRRRPGALLGSGAIVMGATAVFMVLLVAAVGGGVGLFDLYVGSMASRQAASMQIFGGMGVLSALAYVVGMAVVGSMMMFTPYLIHEQDLPVMEAIKKSMAGALRNMPAGLVAVAAYVALAFVASIPLLLGWLVLGPVLFLVGYVAYRDIYFQPRA